MKKLLPAIFAIAILTSCSSAVEIANETRDTIYCEVDSSDIEDFSVEASDSEIQYFASSLFQLMEYDIDVYGRYKFFETTTIEVIPSLTDEPVYTLTVEADAGCLEIYNASSYTIDEVYLEPSYETTWGSDELSGTLGYGESTYWRISADSYGDDWDVKIVTTTGTYYTFLYPYDEITIYKGYTKKITVYSTYASVMSVTAYAGNYDGMKEVRVPLMPLSKSAMSSEKPSSGANADNCINKVEQVN